MERLSSETPAIYIVFDYLIDGNGQRLVGFELKRRRQLLEAFAKRNLKSKQGVRLSPATTKLTRANEWFERVGNSLDGIIAKRLDRPYDSGTRTAMVKVKNRG